MHHRILWQTDLLKMHKATRLFRQPSDKKVVAWLLQLLCDCLFKSWLIKGLKNRWVSLMVLCLDLFMKRC
ncbi:hypothetical protein ACFC84_15035 [Enterococcus casseliflavus]